MYGRANKSWSRLENLSNASFPFVQSCSDTHQQHKGAAPHREESSSKLTPSGPGFSASVLPGEPPGAARFLRTVGWCNGNTSGPYPGECGFDSRPCMRHLTGCASRSPAGERSGIGLYGVPAAKPRLQLRRRALFPCIGGTDTFQPEENIMPCGKKKGGGKRK